MNRRLRILHAVHDFLPRHAAGSELYVAALARAQSSRHDVFVVAAEYDPAAPHGILRWRECVGLPVIEIVNNWKFGSLHESYVSDRLNGQLAHVLDAVRPDVLHIHNLLNLSFDLPRLAHERGAAVVATLHDYSLVCPSGGQRLHLAESHLCADIDPERCSRCFAESPFYAQMAVRHLTRGRLGTAVSAATYMARRFTPWMYAFTDALPGPPVSADEIRARLLAAQQVLESIDLFVSPSRSLADEYVRLGLPPSRILVSDNGFEMVSARPRVHSSTLRVGFVGTLAWHKGAHLLIDALRRIPRGYKATLFGDLSTFPPYTRRLRSMAVGHPIHFEGHFSRDRVADVYARIDVLVVPSLWLENSPLVIHEAFMHRVPVVAARIGGIPELVEHDINGLLYDPFSPDALAAALTRLIDDPALLRRLSASAPRVKSIDDDAGDWDSRYLSVIDRAAAVPVAT